MFYFAKTELPPEAKESGAKVLWRPSFVFFQIDWSLKGLALFTTHANADGYRMLLEQNQSYPVSVTPFENIPEYASAVVDHVRSAEVAYKKTPVYIDPETLFCKGPPLIQPNFASLEKFLFKNFASEMPWAHDLVGMTPEKNFTIMLLQCRSTRRFVAVCMKGAFADRESISAAIQDAMGTTDEVYVKRSEPEVTPEKALAVVTEHIDRLATGN